MFIPTNRGSGGYEALGCLSWFGAENARVTRGCSRAHRVTQASAKLSCVAAH